MQTASKLNLYKTARTKAEVWGIPAGAFVSVRFAGFARNVRFENRVEPIYMIRANGDEPWRGHVFGDSALDSFVL